MPDIFAVIADGTRRDLLRALLDRRTTGSGSGSGSGASGELSVSELVAALGLSQPTVSKHLRVLRDAGLVHVREEGQHRYYGVETAPLETVEDWLLPFLSADVLGLDLEALEAVEGSPAFAAWAGAAVPAPLRRAAENLPDADDVGATLGRTVADARHRAGAALDPVLKRLGRHGD
ncbi:ArsR/SmtB family transcription factor [Frigoribacterium salinisoli]